MFSEDDLLDIYNSLPPDKQLQSGSSTGLPLLIRTINGRGFITERSLHREFLRLATEHSSRLSLLNASSKLSVDIHVVIQLVKANSAVVLLNQSQQQIVLQQERDTIVKALEESLEKGVVSRSKFLQEHDLHRESLDSLLRTSNIKESLADGTEDSLLSKAFLTTLSGAVEEKLIHALDEHEYVSQPCS